MEQYQHYLEIALTIIGALSAALAALKPFLAKLPVQWRFWVDGAVTLLDFVALNTKRMSERPYPHEKQEPRP